MCTEVLGQPSSLYEVTRIDLVPNADLATYTRGTSEHLAGGVHTIASKLVVNPAQLPVQSNAILTFNQENDLSYRALLYELRDKASGNKSSVVPNWFGVAIPEDFDLSADVYVVLFFHPMPGQAGYKDGDYFGKTGNSGTDWKRLFAYVDRLGGQAAGAIRYGVPANRLVVFPFLTSAQYTLHINEWFNVLHEILKDINTNYVPGICTYPKRIIVATLSNGSFYLNRFLSDAAGHANNGNIIQAWDFDSEISNPVILVNPHGKKLRTYWQGAGTPPMFTSAATILLPSSQPNSWQNFPAVPPVEVPPLPIKASYTQTLLAVHHYIRDMMFLDAVWNIENDNVP